MSKYWLRAVKTETSFFKKVKGIISVSTVSGKVNVIEKVTVSDVYIKTGKSQNPFKIPRKKIREALQDIFYRRWTGRSELQQFTAYTSALLALVHRILSGICKIQRLKSGYRLFLKGTRFFFSGCDRSVRDLEIAAANGAEYILLSFYYLSQFASEVWKRTIKRLGLKVFLDCGEYTRYAAILKGKETKPISLEEYANFIIKHADVLYACISLDCVGDPEQSKSNYGKLRALVGDLVEIIPVWHIQSDWSDLQELVDEEHPLIAIGGSIFVGAGGIQHLREKFKDLFRMYPSQPFHRLGGASSLLFEFEWFSADSSSWLVGRKYGKIITTTGQMRAPELTDEERIGHNVRLLCKLEQPNVQMDLV